VSSTITEIFVFALTEPSLSDLTADHNPAGVRAVGRIPSEFNPQVVIEVKFTEDDGTARDKVTRVQHLAALSGRGCQPARAISISYPASHQAGRGDRVLVAA
jgi:hypothetical protein